MVRQAKQAESFVVVLAGLLFISAGVLANGGPFVVKYPSGDPAAKGTVAVIDPDLKPARESRLKVLKEDLQVTFLDQGTQEMNVDGKVSKRRVSDVPLVKVTAAYQIENPMGQEIEVDFGFPILRGIYLSPFAMMPSPDVQVRLDEQYVSQEIISNSAIYGVIRQKSRETIEAGINARPELARLVKAVKDAEAAGRAVARTALSKYLTSKLKWDVRDAALMVEYASNRFQVPEDVIVVSGGYGLYSSASWPNDRTPTKLTYANLGPLRAIGEQKATQFFAQLASAFDPKAASTYESIFAAWGGDVRERSVDIKTGKVRPREITVEPEPEPTSASDGAVPVRVRSLVGIEKIRHEYPSSDPTIYARVDYLDKNANITEAEKASCLNVLKNLDVIFTFAPMNLLHYKVKFPANSTKTLKVEYKQYAYTDTGEPGSYQMAYVVHPASLWDSFGPINLDIAVPEGVGFRASVPTTSGGVEERDAKLESWGDNKKLEPFAVHKGALGSKKDEIFLAVDSASWRTKYPIEVVESPASAAGTLAPAGAHPGLPEDVAPAAPSVTEP